MLMENIMRVVAKVKIEKHHDELAIHILSQELCKVSLGNGRQFEQLERILFALLNGNGGKSDLYLEVCTNLPTDSVPEIIQSMIMYVNSLLAHLLMANGPQMYNAATYDRIAYYFNSKGWII